MQVLFVGVGEAFDPALPNCSVWVGGRGTGPRVTGPKITGSKVSGPEAFDPEEPGGSLLLDCGFTAPFSFWRLAADPMGLDGVWISHFHGDHFMGLPALLLRFWEEGRTRPLHVIGPAGVEDVARRAMEMAYAGVLERLGYGLVFHELAPDNVLEVAGFTLEAAPTEHPMPNLALRLSDGFSTLYYSGDGRPTEAARALARGAELVVHEAFTLEADTPGHGTVDGALAFGREAGAAFTALVHLRRDVRAARLDEVRERMDAACSPGVLLPMPGDGLELEP